MGYNERGEHLKRNNDMRRGRRRFYFDDDPYSFPRAKSSIPSVDGNLVLFTDASDRVVTKFDKTYPEVSLARKDIPMEGSLNVLVYEAGNGYLALPLAAAHPDSNFYLYDSDVTETNLTQRNLNANIEVCRNAHVIASQELEEKPKQSFDRIIYEPKGYSAIDLVLQNITDVNRYLKPEGKFYLVSHVKQGAERYVKLIGEQLGGEASIVGRGRGGFRIIEITNITGKHEQENRLISFNILGREFEAETDSSLFSKDDLDSGARLLLETAELTHAQRILDVGCGWGPIGIVSSAINPSAKILMTDANSRAVNVANRNAERLGLSDRVAAIAVDVIDDEHSSDKFDLVLSNPPFHETASYLTVMFNKVKKVTVGSGQIVIAVEKTYLNKFLDVMQSVFGNVETLNQNGGYFVLRSIKK